MMFHERLPVAGPTVTDLNYNLEMTSWGLWPLAIVMLLQISMISMDRVADNCILKNPDREAQDLVGEAE